MNPRRNGEIKVVTLLPQAKPGACRRRETGKAAARLLIRNPSFPVTAGMLAFLSSLVGCQGPSESRVISLQDLESAPRRHPGRTERLVVSDASNLRSLYTPLGRRLGLIQVRDAREWQQLLQAAPSTDLRPDFQRGVVVGLASPCGRSLDGTWPFSWDAVRMYDGAGLIEARFNAGSYLPDGTTYLETAFVEGLAAVLVVSVDGVHYYPD